MADALFRIRDADGTVRLARGDSIDGPTHVHETSITLDSLLAADHERLADAARAGGEPMRAPDASIEVLAPVETQEVWAAGVTYGVSLSARMDESETADVYARIAQAQRPEIFFKANAWRVVGPGGQVGIRNDSAWNVPEPELALVLDHRHRIAGYSIGNDVSSRSIEGENPLYLPQAKVYDRACSLGPCIVPADTPRPFDIRLRILRSGAVLFDRRASTEEMQRSFEELARYAGRALSSPVGMVLLTGTSLVPEPPFTLLEGDEVCIDIAGIGQLTNTVVTVGARR